MDDLIGLAKCSECPLALNGKPRHTPVRGAGDENANLVVIGEAPGRSDVVRGAPFVGQSGRLLSATLEDVGGHKDQSWFTNTTLCVPGKGGKVGPKAMECCRPRLVEEIRRVSPKILVTVGTTAAQSVMQVKEGITKLEGAVYDSTQEEFGAPCLPTYHPAAVLHGAEGFYPDIEDALRKAVSISQGVYEPPALDHKVNWKWFISTEPTKEALRQLLEKVRTGGQHRFSLDLETDGLNFKRDCILEIGIYDGETAYCFEYEGRRRRLTEDPKEVIYEARELHVWDDECCDLFRELMLEPNVEWVLHNQSFDLQFIQWYLGQIPTLTRDTMCLALGLTEQGSRVGLKKLARTWFNATNYDGALAEWFTSKNKKLRRFSEVPREVLAKYLAFDVYYTWHLVPYLEKEVEREGTRDLVDNLLQPLQRMFAKWEATGIKLDRPYVEELERIWTPKILAAEKELQLYARNKGFDAHNVVKKPKGGSDLNPRSPKQLAHLLFDILGLPTVRGSRTTGKDFLEAQPDHEITPKIEYYRTLTKMMSTYVTGIDKLAWADGRVHPDIMLFGTVTGRLAIKSPPMQTIPIEKRLRANFNSLRKLFIAEQHGGEEHVIAEIDYKTLEMRVAWHLSEDPVLGDSLMQEDFHTATASKIFGIPMSEVTKEQRHASKFVSFGIIYGRQAFSLAKGELNCSVQEAQDFIDRFFKLYSRFYSWWMDTQRQAFEDQYLVTPTGRKRRWPLITAKNAKEVRNQSVNFPVQSFASDINLMAALRLDDHVRAQGWGSPLIAVHDSILFELKKSALGESIPYIVDIMTTPQFPTCATFEVDVEIGRSWGEVVELLPPYVLP